MDDAFEIDSNSGIVLYHEEIFAHRLKQGKCMYCPNTLFEFHKSSLIPFKKVQKIPLTIPGHILEGRCLDCHPINVQIVSDGSIETKKYNDIDYQSNEIEIRQRENDRNKFCYAKRQTKSPADSFVMNPAYAQ
mmetsp:Transcript_26274/g.31791  ORF Transcript_26274/g.31791 Transcript_26274/m.31791 type:complete len:133 (+) Transcript_26274:137-535(+)